MLKEVVRGVSGVESHLRNVISCRRAYFELNVKNAFRKPETLCMPHTINAYYNTTTNEMIIPMGFLQAPLLNITSDLALQYGSFGAMIGHELCHGFDCLGRHYDAEGRVRNWWSPMDSDTYNRRSKKMVGGGSPLFFLCFILLHCLFLLLLSLARGMFPSPHSFTSSAVT